MHRTLLGALLLFFVGCGGPAPDPDSGTPDAGPMDDAGSDGGTDAGPNEDPAPSVVETTPADGTVNVSAAMSVLVRFSEDIATQGSVSVRAEGVDVIDATISLAGDELTIAPSTAWPVSAEIEIRLGADFLDASGQGLPAPYVFRFTIDDTGPPTIVSSSPADGATDVSVRVGAVRVRFSEPMDQAAGTLSIEGATVAATPSWSLDEVTFGVSGLAHDTTYRAVLSGFTDRAGNPLSGTSEIDFTTGGDDEAPRVVDAAPNEGQVDVSTPELAGVVVVRFDEAMDTSTASVPVTVGATASTASVEWTAPDVARIDVADIVALDAVHSIDLRSLRDVAGNVLAPEPVLVDGRLDFTTGADAFVPFVAASSPSEGATGVSNPLREVRIAFSEAMDETRVSVPISDELGNMRTIDGTWSNGGTVLTLPGSVFTQGRRNQVDLRGLVDRAGTAVSPVHAYLGDGILVFTLARPTGESCAQPLGVDQADITMSGYYEFTILATQRTRYNGSGSCDYDTFGVEGGDVVVHYRKTTPALSAGGTALRVRTYNVTNRATVEVFAGVCDPRDAAAPSAMIRCAYDHGSWDLPLDVGPGDYYIWVSNAASFSGSSIRMSVEEIATIEEGESCADPYDTSSAIYTPPALSGDPHVWTIPASTGSSVDITSTNARYGALSCSEEMSDDAVIRFDKVAEDTVLDVRVDTGSFARRFEVVSGACQRSATGATSAGCMLWSTAVPRRMTVRAPAGPTYVWLGYDNSSNAFPGGTVTIREIPAPSEPGSSCANAIPIAASGTVAITPSHAGRYDGPTCTNVDANITWYAFDTTERLTHVRANAAGAIALVDPASRAELGCLADATTAPLFRFAPVGSRVCVAVESGAAITSLTIEPIPYTGAGALPPSIVPITSRATLEGTVFDDSVLLNEIWMRVTPTTILQTIGASVGILEIPRAGGATIRHLEYDSRVLGRGTFAIGEQLFIASQIHPSAPRLFRLRDENGAWNGTVWDRGTLSATYTQRTNTLAYDGTDLYATGEVTSATGGATAIFRWPASAPGLGTAAGTITGAYQLNGLAMDASYLYVCGRTSTDNATRGVFRVSRADLASTGTAVANRIATLPLATSAGAACPIAVDTLTAARYLYVRDDSGRNVHVIGDPSGTTPRYLGIVFYGDADEVEYGMDVDRTSGSLFVFSTRDNPEGGEWYRLDP